LKYADYIKQEVSHSPLDIDHVMEWGFGWQMGPFKMLDAIGPEKARVSLPKFYEGHSFRAFDGSLKPIHKDPRYASPFDFPLLEEGETYRLRDLGDGVKAVSLTTKMGVISTTCVDELTALFESDKLDRTVLTSEARSFSAGFDLKFFSKAIAEERWIDIDAELAKLQRLGELIEKTRTVGAVYGHVLGAGLEIALSTAVIVAAVETSVGLPESKVGLLPAGRGLTLVRLNNQHTAKRLSEVTYNVALGTVSKNVEEARVLGYLRPTDVTIYHPDTLLFEAKQVALSVEPTPRPEISTSVGPLSGMIDRLLEVGTGKGLLTNYDETIGQKMKSIISKAATYEDCLAKERSEFLDLCGKALTTARINHMLTNGVPLRN
jgi:3-hydroxyacyl-CoA dehydrogenase